MLKCFQNHNILQMTALGTAAEIIIHHVKTEVYRQKLPQKISINQCTHSTQTPTTSKDCCLQFSTEYCCLTAKDAIFSIQLLLKKCLDDTLQQMQLTLHSFKITRCRISLHRARVKGVKFNSGTTCLSETKYQAHSGSASCGYKASAWQGE